MALSTGTKNIKTAVFISGKGSNLKSLIKFSKHKKSPISIEIIISNNPKSKGLTLGKIYKIRKKIFNFSKQAKTEKEILELLKKRKINLICLAGFMRILSKNFIQNFKGQILNIHPSLLPKYKGLNTHERAINNKDSYSGCTVHFVTSEVDHGPIIIQATVPVLPDDTNETLAARVLLQEHRIFPEAVHLFVEGRLKISGSSVKVCNEISDN